jgi:very-short-patch-repair endonuclease
MDENAIAKLAARQHGVVSAGQLHAAGFDHAAIKRRCRAGRLHRLHRGVYLVGHPVAPEHAAEIAAVLACGPGSVVSHRSAARLWGLPGFRAWTTPVEVTVPDRNPRCRRGIMVHRSGTLHPREVRRVHGIPVTIPARTLLDVAPLVPLESLEAAIADARARRVVRDRVLMELIERSPGRPGASALRRLVELNRDHGLTRSEAERTMLALVRAADLPVPRTNARVSRFEVDFLWHTQKVVVEVDGYAFHSGVGSFERDRERDAVLVAQGYVVLRVTWRQLIARREAVVARLAAALSVRS